jgi:hypothetical protein
VKSKEVFADGASIHVTNSNRISANQRTPVRGHYRGNLQKSVRIRIVLIWLKFKHGISWTHGKVNHFRWLQATSVIRTKREVQSRRLANGAEILPLFQGAGAAVGNSI